MNNGRHENTLFSTTREKVELDNIIPTLKKFSMGLRPMSVSPATPDQNHGTIKPWGHRKMQTSLQVLVFAALANASLALAITPTLAAEEPPVHVTFMSGGVGGYPPVFTCESRSAEEVRSWRPPEVTAGVWMAASSQGRGGPDLSVPSEPPYPGKNALPGAVVPSHYVHPHQHIVETGELALDQAIDLPRLIGPPRTRFDQVASIQVPDWAEQILVRFDPDPTMSTFTGLWVRPDRPFESAAYPDTAIIVPGGEDGFIRTEIAGFAQATHYAMTTRGTIDRTTTRPSNASSQTIWLHPQSDPVFTGRSLHVALGHVRSTGSGNGVPADTYAPIQGRLRIWFTASDQLPPIGIHFHFSPIEYANQTGFFDPTPRTPDGDNPGTTLGEAMRWILYRSTEELINRLDLPHAGGLPLRVLAQSYPMERGAGLARTAAPWVLHPIFPLPDRFGGEQFQDFRLWQNPQPTINRLAMERAAGTSGCFLRAYQPLPSSLFLPSHCRDSDADNRFSAIPLYVDFKATALEPKPNHTVWDLNWIRPSTSNRTQIRGLMQHEIGHIIGINGWEMPFARGYVHTFEPPLSLRLAPEGARQTSMTAPAPVGEGEWIHTNDRLTLVGPNTVVSPYNPWAGTVHPGVRLDDRLGRGHGAHPGTAGLGDDWAQWRDAPESGGLMRGTVGVGEVGLMRAMLKDMGLDPSIGVYRDARLPRLLFDPSYNGHGVDFRRIVFPDGSMAHFLHFYTYDADGDPVWYMAIGQLDETGVFEADLDWFTYEAGRNPPQQADPARRGRIRLDFYPSRQHPACGPRLHPNYERGTLRKRHIAMDWTINGESGQWCLQPLIAGDMAAMPVDVTGSWYAEDPNDVGWGFTVLNRHFGPRPILNTILYYYDANGQPTWAWGVTGGNGEQPYGAVQAGVDIEMLHFRGYCRTCPAVAVDPTVAGHLRLRLGDPTGPNAAQNFIESLQITNHGPGGGTWNRENIGLQPLSSPNPVMLQ